MEDLERQKHETDVTFRWKNSEGQQAWVKIGFSFLAFYLGEAVLFWQGGPHLGAPLFNLPLAAPLVYPLGFWALFGVSIFVILRKEPASAKQSVAAKRFLRWQGTLLTLSITVGVVGIAYIVMKESGNTTLGHVSLFLALFLSAAVIGSMELNVGWLLAAIVWFLTAVVINTYPESINIIPRINDEDILIGIATALGFFLIGKFPQCYDRGQLYARDSGNQNSQQGASADG